MYMGCLRAALFLQGRKNEMREEAGRCAAARRAVLAGLCLAVLITGWLSPFARTAARVRRDTLRLHVRAAGDSWQDLQVKYRVRDAILEQAGALLAPAASEGEAAALAAQSLPALQIAAQQAASRAGAHYSVTVRLVRQYFPTTRYEGFQLPAGQYQALRVELGQAEGRNWWCVLYPGLCLAASSLPAGYGDTAEQGLVVGEYEIRFALLELWQRTACRDIPAAGGIG